MTRSGSASPVGKASTAEAIDAEVAIVGYGPVGVTAANMLGKLGVRTVVVERDANLYSRARAISTDEEVIRIWQSIGLAEQLKADMLGDRPIDFVGLDGRSFLSITPKPHGNGHPPQMFIYQPALEQTLRDGVPRFESVRVLLGHEAVGISQDDEGVTLRVRRTEPDAEELTVRATYVIAADGGSSPTRRALGVGFEGRTYEGRWVVIDTKVLTPWPEVDRLRFHCTPSRPAVDCPTPLGHHRWEFPVLPEDDEEVLVTHDAIHGMLRQLHIDPANVEILRAVVYSHHVRFADQWRVGRVFLAGDAAHVMPPWIGEGMASGVRDAANLTWKLAAVLEGRLPDSVLDTYEIERQPHVRKLTQSAVTVGRLITERRRPVAMLRDPFMRTAARVPLVGRSLREGSWFPEAQYTGSLAKITSRRRSGAVGRLISQPEVFDEQGRLALLDDALPTGWVVLARGSGMHDRGIEAWRRCGIPIVEVLPPGSRARPGAIIDRDNELHDWLEERGATAVALRPDRFVFTSGSDEHVLAPPPVTGGSRARPVSTVAA